MQKYKSNITTTSGAAVRNVPVTVFKEDSTLATLYRDRYGQVPAPNPLQTGADGTFSFYAENGRYSLRTTVEGVTITDDDVVLLADPAEQAMGPPAPHTHPIDDVTGLQLALDGKQPVLIPGTTLKTINGNSLLGAGDLAIVGGDGGGGLANAVFNTPVLRVATAGQVLFTLPASYTVGNGSLAVYRGGQRLYIGLDYAETSSTQVTLVAPAAEGEQLLFVIGVEVSTAGDGPGSTAWDDITGKPASFPPSAHTHPISEVTGLQDELDAKQPVLVPGTTLKTINGNSLLGEGDLVIAGGGGGGGGDMYKAVYDSDNDGVVDAAQSAPWGGITGKPGTFPPSAHSHDAATTSAAGFMSAADKAKLDGIAAGATANAGDVTLNGAQTLTNKTLTSPTVDVVKFPVQYSAGNSGAAVTVNFANGQKQSLTLTGNATVTLQFPGVGNYQLLLTQDATGSRTVTWSGVSRYVGSATAPAINTTANNSTVVSIYFDGTNAWLAASKVNA
jgi:hypothetical protein